MGGYYDSVSTALSKSAVPALVLICPFCGPIVLAGSEVPAESLQDARSAVREVRVLIAMKVERVRLRSPGAISIYNDDGMALGTHDDDDWEVVSRDGSGGIRFGASRWRVASIDVQPDPIDTVEVSVYRDGEWSVGNRYPGTLRIIVRDDGGLDVVNAVEVEGYVACVVANEVWPTFETEAYRAQAIAARTFVLHEMLRRNRAKYDVTATQRSQVYRGIRTDEPGRRAREAARYTRGIVLTYRRQGQDRLFCTYYSAACGGMSQSAAIFGRENDIQPLSGGVRCDYCKIAPGETYRWGPVHLTKQEVKSRLLAKYPKLRSLGEIQEVTVIERTPSGRPVRLRITGSGGESHDMLAERFRLAIGGSEIKSTDFTIRVTRREVIFENGRGFGHGLGLCQWGMQGQALQGKRADEILQYYYPGSKLTRVY